MNDIFDFLNEEFANAMGFRTPVSIRFSTGGTLDRKPGVWRKWEVDGETSDSPKVVKGYKAIVRAVGIDEKDIKVSFNSDNFGNGNDSIIVKGETTFEGEKYSQYVELPVSKELLNRIKRVTYSAKNGLLHVYLELDAPKHEQIPIEKV